MVVPGSAPFQRVGGAKPDRIYHVWYEVKPKQFKCVLCGGISHHPSNHAECERYESLTVEERSWCPSR